MRSCLSKCKSSLEIRAIHMLGDAKVDISKIFQPCPTDTPGHKNFARFQGNV